MVWKWIIGIILILIAWSLVERKLLRVTHYRITSDKLKQGSQPVHLVVLADLHNNSFGEQNERLVRKIQKIHPDLIVAAGDIITKNQLSYPSHGYDLLELLSKSYPVYYGFGNHELYYDEMKNRRKEKLSLRDQQLLKSWEEYITRLKESGVHILKDETVPCTVKNHEFDITGLNLDTKYYPKGCGVKLPKLELSPVLGEASGKYQILIAHHPAYFDAYISWGADLTLSGHIHGGLARLPFLGGVVSPQYRFFPKYDGGLYRDRGKNMVVSKGIGSHSIMLRLFNPPDIVHIQISPRPEKR